MNNQTQEALKMAIEALLYGTDHTNAIKACKEALEQTPQESLKMAKYNLDGVIADVEKFDGFDDVCLKTIKRVRSVIAKALEQPAQSDVDLELKQFSKNLIDRQIQDEHPLSSEQLWGLYETEQPAQEPLTQEKYEQLKNQATQWTSSLPMFVHLINKHFGVDDGLDWGQK